MNICNGCKQPMDSNTKLFNPWHRDCWVMHLRDCWRNEPQNRKRIEHLIAQIKDNEK